MRLPLLAALLAPALLPAQTTTYITRLGTDTVAAERITVRGDTIHGVLFNRSPNVRTTTYTLVLAARGQPARLAYAATRPDGTAVGGFRTVEMRWQGDSVLSVGTVRDDSTVRRTAAAKGGIPFLANSALPFQLIVDRMRAAKADTGTLVAIGPFQTQTNQLPARITGRTSAIVTYFGDPMEVTLDRDGRIAKVDGAKTTNKMLMEVAPRLDVAALATSFGARERQQGAMGQTSPRDTARATIAGQTLWVDYGRPSKRGREIWGGIVPHGQVWRTGANAATQFHTPVDLVMGGQTIPAGTYTLWTLPAADGSAQLIVNRQTKQWGTEYKPEQDLVRIPMQRKSANPTERFTIAIVPSGDGGQLELTWDTTAYVVPFTVKK